MKLTLSKAFQASLTSTLKAQGCTVTGWSRWSLMVGSLGIFAVYGTISDLYGTEEKAVTLCMITWPERRGARPRLISTHRVRNKTGQELYRDIITSLGAPPIPNYVEDDQA